MKLETPQQYTTYNGDHKPKGKRRGLNVEERCKIDRDPGANAMPIFDFRKLCLAMFDLMWKALEKFDSDWTTLTACEVSMIKQFGVRVIKCIWSNKI